MADPYPSGSFFFDSRMILLDPRTLFFWIPAFFLIPGSISRNPGSFLLIQGFFIVGFRIRIFFLTFNPLQSGILQQQKIGSAALKTFHAAVNVG